MDFSFGVDTTVKSKNQSKIVNSICIASKHNNNKKHLLLLLESHIKNEDQFKFMIKTMLDIKMPDFDYDVVVSTKLNSNREDIRKAGVYRYYQENKSDYESYINNNTVIVSSGYALQAITLDGNLSIDCFYDYIFNKTYFYSPRTQTYVFPIDSSSVLFSYEVGRYIPIDCSRVEFMMLQLTYIKEHYEELESPPVPKRFKTIECSSREEWLEICGTTKKYNKISLDIETDGLDFNKNRIGCITFSFDGKTGYYVPWKFVKPEELDLMIKDKYQIGANKKFDDKFLKFNGVNNVYTHSDVLQLGHLLNEMRFNGLKSLAYYYTQYGGYDYELDQYIQNFKPDSYLDIPMLPSYAAQDAIHTFNIEAEMQKQLTQLDIDFPPEKEGDWAVRRFYEEIIIPFQNLFVDIELRGFNVDMKKWEEGAATLDAEIMLLKEDIKKELDIDDVDFNMFDDESEEKDQLQSAKKLGEILEKLGWENLGRTKGGWYKTGDDQLLRWFQLGHTEAQTIQKMRSYLTLQKTFIGKPNENDKGWKPFVVRNGDNTTIHSTYKVMLMDTYRNGCGSPNYQQTPSSSKNLGDTIELFKRILTVPYPKKQYLTTLDFAGIQLRLAAIDSEDEVLCKAYRDNPDADIHSKTAFNIFCQDENFEVEEIVLKDSTKTLVLFPHENVNIIRDGEKIIVKAIDVVETDKLV